MQPTIPGGIIHEVPRCWCSPAASLLAIASDDASLRPKPRYGTWGYDATAMDSAVKPGDDFFDYVERHLGQAHRRSRPTAPSPASIPCSTTRSSSDVREIVEDMAKDSAANRPHRPADRRPLRQLDGRGRASSSAAPRRSSPISPRSPRSRPAASSSSCSPTPGFASPVDIGIYPDLKDPTRYSAYAGQARLGLPNRDYYLLKGAKYDAYPQRLPQLHRRAAAARRHHRPGSARRPHHRARNRDREDPLDARAEPRRRQDLQSDDPRAAARRSRRSSNGTARSRKLGLGNGEQGRRRRDERGRRRAASSSPSCRCRRGRTDPPSTSSATTRTICPRRSTTRSFDFYSQDAARRPEQRARWKRGVDCSTAALGEGVGQIYVAATLSGRERRGRCTS